MQRMFVAVVPPAHAVEHLHAAVRQLDASVDGLRWTVVEHWHLTLAFLPAVSADAVAELTERLERAARRRSVEEARLARAGAFPRAGRATVVWAGVGTEGSELHRLAAGARAAARRTGVPSAPGPFRPHVTLARLSRPRDVGPVVAALGGYAGPAWPVDRVRLVASHLGEGPGGRPRYETLAELPLAGA